MMHNASDGNTPACCRVHCHGFLWLALLLAIGGGIFLFSRASAKPQSCEPTTIALGPQSELMKVKEKGEALTVWLQENGVLVVRRYSMCDGSILRDVRLTGGTRPAAPNGALPR